jgi:peroxiredoxin Q/BCP
MKSPFVAGFCAAGALLTLGLFAGLPAEDAKSSDKSLAVGDAAPEFVVKDDQGKDWKSADHFGKKIVVVYFYPADMTGGCTKQACGFRDDTAKLKEAGVEVVGVSGDSVANHQIFKKAHNLPFTLLADEKGTVAAGFGVPFTPGEKEFKTTIDGKEVTLTRLGTAKRWTFVVDQDGKIAFKNEMVDAPGDSQAILKVVKDLKKS